MLSGGTDGLDGPSPAAGAVWRTESHSLTEPERARASLERNDSFGFLSGLEGALLVTGHTGTNVADIVICKIVRSQGGSLTTAQRF